MKGKCIRFVSAALACAAAGAALAQTIVVDDFTTGMVNQTIQAGSWSGMQTGTMLGGDRLTGLNVLQNLYGFDSNVSIGGGIAAMNNGVGVKSEFSVAYGYEETAPGVFVEQDLNLGPATSVNVLLANGSGAGRVNASIRKSDAGIFSYGNATWNVYGYNYDQPINFSAGSFGLSSLDGIDQLVVSFVPELNNYYGNGNDAAFKSITMNANPVPEPGTMIALGAAGALFLRRRKKA